MNTPKSPAMVEVDRLEIYSDEGGTLIVNTVPNGEYVRAHDHDSALAAERAEVVRLREALFGDNGALTRMDRARGWLTDDKPTAINSWGVLDTSDLRAVFTRPIIDSRCNYAMQQGRLCNKCGRLHDGGQETNEATPPVVSPDTAPMYKALMFAKTALIPVGSGASIKALSLIDGVLNAIPVGTHYSFVCYSCAHEWETTDSPDGDCPKCGTTNRFSAENPAPIRAALATPTQGEPR